MRKPKKDGVFTIEDDKRILSNIHTLFDRTMLWDCQSPLTKEEVFELVVPAIHRQLAQDSVRVLSVRASQLYNFSGVVSSNGRARVESDTELSIYCFTADWYYPNRGLDFTHPAWKDKVIPWIEKRLEISRQWTLVREVYKTLKRVCPNTQHVRNLWPPVVTLLGNSPTAEALASFRQVQSTPISPELRKACTQTMEWVTLACLLPEEDAPENPTTLTIPSASIFHKLPWRFLEEVQAI